MAYDIETGARSVLTRQEARASLRRFKKTPAYTALLKRTIAESVQLEKRATTRTGKCRARLDRMTAELELAQLVAGGRADEFSGLLALPDPLKGADQL